LTKNYLNNIIMTLKVYYYKVETELLNQKYYLKSPNYDIKN